MEGCRRHYDVTQSSRWTTRGTLKASKTRRALPRPQTVILENRLVCTDCPAWPPTKTLAA